MSVSTNPIVSNVVVAPIDRTAATPPISFGGDAVNNSGTGIYLKSAGVIAVASSGADALIVNPTYVALTNDVCFIQGSGVPTDGVTGATIAGPGSLYIRVSADNSNVYINCNTKASPTWKLVTRAA